MNTLPRVATAFAFGLMIAAAQLSAADRDADSTQQIRAAVERGLAVVQKGAASYPAHRQCFSCHHQTLPLLAMTAARDAGVSIDEPLLESQLEFTRKSFEDRRDRLQKGEGIGGKGATVGYALWTLHIAAATADELSADLVTYLLKTQEPDGFWRPQSIRPPLEESNVTCTVLSVYGMRIYAADSQRDEVEKSAARATEWLNSAALESHEDRVMRLWAFALLGTAESGGPKAEEKRQHDVLAARKDLLDRQREDGSWPQLADMPGDAYATGQTLFVLRETGMPATAREFRSGIEFLLKTQRDDGSWFVKSRSKPVQTFFDNGDPHGKDQFISIAATAWATAALATAIDPATSD